MDLDDLFCKSPQIVPPDRLLAMHKYFSESAKRLGAAGNDTSSSVGRLYRQAP